jgi:hypothetical protein
MSPDYLNKNLKRTSFRVKAIPLSFLKDSKSNRFSAPIIDFAVKTDDDKVNVAKTWLALLGKNRINTRNQFDLALLLTVNYLIESRSIKLSPKEKIVLSMRPVDRFIVHKYDDNKVKLSYGLLYVAFLRFKSEKGLASYPFDDFVDEILNETYSRFISIKREQNREKILHLNDENFSIMALLTVIKKINQHENKSKN